GRGGLHLEVPSTPPGHRARGPPLPAGRVAVIRTPSLSEPRAGAGGGVLPGGVGGPAGGLQRLAAVRRPGGAAPAGAARAPDGDAAGLSGGGDRAGAVGAGGGDVARAGLPGAVHDDAPGAGGVPAEVAPLAAAAPAV